MAKKSLYSFRKWLFIGGLAITQGCLGLLDPNDHNRGLIVSDYPTDVPTGKRPCYSPDFFAPSQQLATTNVVIDSDSALRAYFDYARYGQPVQNFPNDPCRGYQPEPVDFTKFTLLGHYASGQCEVAFTRQVERNDQARQYLYTINVRDAGSCKRLGYSMNWVLIPKIQPGYEILFRVK